MIYENILLVVLGIFMLLAAFAVISVKNPIYSILFLITVFFFGACLLILLDVEFLAMVLLIVYIGAIAVLFLFIVMMLKIKGLEIKNKPKGLHPLTILFIFWLFALLIIINTMDFSAILLMEHNSSYNIVVNLTNKITNIEVLGLVLYTYFYPIFLVASLVLLVAMIGSIILTLTNKTNPKKQDLFEQQVRDFNKTLILKKYS